MNRVIVCCECGRKHTIDMKTSKIIEPMKEDEFEVGDIVDAKGVLSDNNLPRGIVTKVCDDSIYVLFADGSCGVHSKKNFRKIGLTAKKTLNWLEEVINAVSTPSPASNGAAYMGNLIDSACRNWSWNECPLRNGK